MPVALVTGAARGIGAATARRLHADGWQLVLLDVCADDPALDYPMATEAELDRVARETRAIAHVGDVRDQAAVDAAAAEAVRAYGGIDAAVSVAGVLAGGDPLWELPDDAWRALVDVNLTGVLCLARAAVPIMLQRPEPRAGRFVAVSSASATKAMPRLAGYSAAKAGVHGLVLGLAADLAGTGITANVVAPGTTDTSILEPSRAAYGLDDPAEFATHHIDQRLLQPREIASAIAWLCSPDSSAVTGAVLPVDGGMTAR